MHASLRRDTHIYDTVFVTLTYSLSFEMRHDSSCSVHRIPTHTNGSKAIVDTCGILPSYYSGNQRNYRVCGKWTSTDCLSCLHALSSANE